MQWTPGQREAIADRGNDLLVSAAAGSGKTAVLTERIVTLVKEGASIDAMLVVTFTKAAAAEMRARIAAQLHDVAADGDPHLAVQALRVEHASISTLHGFCARVCRDHFEAAGVDPTFRVGDTAEVAVLRAQAMQEALTECFETPDKPAFEALSACYSLEELSLMIEELYTFLMARPDPWQWLEEAIDAHRVDEDGLRASPWMQVLLEKARRAAQEAAQHYAALESFTADLGLFEDFARNEAQQAEDFLAAIDRGYDAALACPKPVFVTRPSKRGLEKEITARFGALRDTAKKVLQTVWTDMQAIADLSLRAQDEQATSVRLQALAWATEAFARRFALHKEERNLLDFSDLEHYALKALRMKAAARAVREQYAYIFVDEYQDSSLLQEALLACVARPASLFLVGDVKQSIYRFRLAEPGLFMDKMRVFRTRARARLIHLNTNFRSQGLLLEGINAVFAHVFSGGAMELGYPREDWLIPPEKDKKETARSELILLSEQALDGGDESAPEPDAADALSAEEKRAVVQEACAIADRVRALIAEDKDIRLSDMVILTRTVRGRAALMMETLRARGIHAWSDLGDSALERTEILSMLAILQVIDNLRQDVPLLAALRGPALGLSEDALSTIRAGQPEGTFADAMLACAAGTGALAQALRDFVECVRGWALDAQVRPLDDLIRQIYDETGFYAISGAQPDGKLRQGNLRMLAERAGAYQREQGGGLSGFLRYIEKTRAHEEALVQDISETDDVLRILSIHKSKGLQFPVVFVAGLGRRFRQLDAHKPLQMHGQLGIGMEARDASLRAKRDTIARQAVVEAQRMQAVAEEARILYVAMTRAEKKLILVGTPQAGDIPRWNASVQPPPAYQAKSMLDWLVPVARESDAWTVTREDFRAAGGEDADAMRYRKVMQAALDLPPPDEKDPVARQLDWAPTRMRAQQLKRSVSSIVRSSEWDEEAPERALSMEDLPSRPLFMEARGMTAAERGSAIHIFLAAVPLDAADVLIARDDLQRRGMLSDEQAKALPVERMREVLASPLWQRMRASRELHREWPFNLRHDEAGERTLIQGTIDCAFLEAGQWVLVDFKSDRSTDEQALAALYQPQLSLYAEALAQITGIPVRERILFLLEGMRLVAV